MKKKILALTMIFCLVGVAVLGGTLAYFTDSEQATNVFTVGKIDIELDEKTAVLDKDGNELDEKTTVTGAGVYFSNIMPTNYLQKEVTIKNIENPAYVRVIVVLNNYLETNKAIDEVYEAKFGKDSDEVQEMYDLVFDGWDIVYTKPEAEGVRGTIDKGEDEKNLLRTDLVTAIDQYTIPAKGNWYENTSVTSATNDFSGYYSCILNAYERAYVYYLYMDEGDEITLFNGLNCPAEFTQEQAKMFENLKIEVYADAIQAESFTGTDAKNAKNQDNAMAAFDALNEAHPIASIRTPSQNTVEISNLDGLKYAASVGGTYKLTADITADDTIVVAAGATLNLDLNGNSITGKTAKDQGAIIDNKGTLIISGSSAQDIISNTAVNGGAVINNTGYLTLDGVTIKGAPIDSTGYPAYAVTTSGKLIIEDGTKILADRGGVSTSAGAEVIINGGEIIVSNAADGRNMTLHTIYAYGKGTKLTINDGKFEMNHSSTGGASVICPAGASITINGGTFSDPIDDSNRQNTYNIQNYMGYDVPILVKGGTFNDKTAKNHIVSGYTYADNGDGTYTVKLKTHDNSSDVSNAIAAGEKVVLGADVVWNTNLSTDAEIDLNENAFKPTTTIKLTNNSDLTMTGGDYVVEKTYGHVDVRPDSADGSKVVFEDVDFTFTKKNKTNGPSTNRLGTVLEFCATTEGAKAEILFKGCTFDNAQVLFEGLSGKIGEFVATFENCTFNCLTYSAPIYVQNYVKGTINVIGCTFNLEATSSTASAISVSSSTSTSITLNAENNTINATAATPYTYDAARGETEEDNIKVNGTPANIKFISAYENTTVTEINTTKTGIAAQ